MRLSMVFELLLIFLLVAFAAYARVIDRDEAATVHRVLRAVANSQKQSNVGVSTISLKQATDNVNKYCTCNDNICNCCRDFNIPVVQLKGPGCASVQYLKGDNMALQLSFGDNILTSTVVNGKSPKPVCVPLPGGFSKFCGRIYSIQREAADHFKACLGLELASSNQVEASLRVSCFRFGPDGLKLRPAEPLPIVESDSSSSDDDDDDDEDIFGLGSDDDDEEDDDDDDEDDEDDAEDTPTGNVVPSSSADDEEGDDDDDDDDVLGLGSLFDIFGDDDAPSKKPKVTTPSPIPPISIPLLTRPITSDNPIVIEASEPATSGNDIPVETTQEEPFKPVPDEELPTDNGADTNVPEITDEAPSDPSTVSTVDDLVPLGSVIEDNVIQPAASSVQEEYVLKPGKDVNKIKLQGIKKPTMSSSSVNAIPNDVKKPIPVLKPKPLKPDPVKNEAVESSEEEEDEDEEEDILNDDDDDEEEEDEAEELVEDDDDDDDKKDETIAEDEDDDDNENNEKKPGSADSDEEEEEEESIVDDDDEEEDELLTALAGDEAKGKQISTNEAADPEADDPDYGLGLAEMLARKRNQRHMRPSGRQSKVMRL